MTRVANFNAGPAALPVPVLERARDELLEFGKSGMSIMEHSHRGKAYEGVHNEAIALLREILAIPETHHVLFLQGGASLQFAMVPMNFLGAGKSADYINTGHWSERAIEETQLIGKVRIAGSTKVGKTFPRVPKPGEIQVDPAAAYVHTTTNNTIEGTQWQVEPDTGAVPLVADASSDILSRRIDVSRYGLIYAGAQKNIGPSGVVVVIARKDLVASGRKDIPTILRYSTFAEHNSLFNTPPSFAVYMVRNVMAWIKEVGGLPQIEAWNKEKGRLLYGTIDAHPDYYTSPVENESRSLMNVVWRLPSEALEEKFVKDATSAGLVGLKGHRSVGGMRASTYNAVTVDDVKKLCGFMEEFAKKNRP
ncbi:MAG: 3-phosphoserine/phosphohydroxythreonine transaminase [Deltaproteobacteria bacterium]|nr:3-phosphoserine/phosphohydroxythreonine transaminase [Deltaproteobacteria bacterium]